VPVATPPRPYQLQGAKSHAGTAGLPEPGPYLPGHTQEGKGATDGLFMDLPPACG
jgi:hypothetical protein